jgi:hypothetical protein
MGCASRPLRCWAVMCVLFAAPSLCVTARAQEAPPEPEETAGSSVPLALTGSYFTRYELRRGYEALGLSAGRISEGDYLVFRARVGLAVGPIALGRDLNVRFQFTPQATGVMGTLPSTIADADLGLYEGYLRVESTSVRFDAGRFMMDYGDSLVIGNLDWHQTGRSFDGFRARYGASDGDAYVDAFFTFLSEGWPARSNPIGALDHYFFGSYAGLGPLLASGLDLDFYALGQLHPATYDLPSDPDDPASDSGDRRRALEMTLGTRVKQAIGVLDYRVEAGIQLGTRPSAPGLAATRVFAHHADLELGLSLPSKALRLGVEGLYASGDDPASGRAEGWNQLYPTAHKFLGLSDAMGARSNVASGVVHLTARPAKGLAVNVDGHVFARPRPTSAGGESGYAGSEVDVGVVYGIGKGLSTRGLYAIFLPSETLYARRDPLHYLEVELRYDLR